MIYYSAQLSAEMTERKKVQGDIDKLLSLLSKTEFSRLSAFTCLRLMFLKYCIDNQIGADTMEKMKSFLKAQRILSTVKSEPESEKELFPAIKEVLHSVDEKYGFDEILSLDENVYEYCYSLLGTNNVKARASASQDDYQKLRTGLMELNLEDDVNHRTGNLLAEQIVMLIRLQMANSSQTAQRSSAEAVGRIAKEILNVQKSESFLDYAAGLGLTTLDITKEEKPSIIHVDSDDSCAGLAAMLYILYGYQSIKVLAKDSLTEKLDGISGDRIFCDPPQRLLLQFTALKNPLRDGCAAAVRRALDGYLNPGGKAVITVSSAFLFATDKSSLELKQEMLRKKCLAAVISLPSLSHITSAGTNLVVLGTDQAYEDVLFIDARGDEEKEGYNKYLKALSEEMPKVIAQIVEARKELENVSKLAAFSKIEEKDRNLIPAVYVPKKKEREEISLEEIDVQLERLYRELADLNTKK